MQLEAVKLCWHRSANWIRMELYADKREKLEQTEAGPLKELKQCILEKNMEIEQEIFLTERYREENI